jgi:hypothetical protein|tara:strand:- start:1772 stop:2422 length:651 start_codon:yes stop_codon:yes gene_type:complete
MSFTYSALKTAIQDYTENTETTFVTHLDDFIKGAEERLLKTVQLSTFRKNASGTFTSSNQFLTQPTDYLASFSLSYTNSSSEKVFLEFKDADFIQTYNPNPATTGLPKYYAVFDIDNFIIAPTPDSSYAAELHYYYRPASLTAGTDSGTTWLSENTPYALLYGSLIEAYIYMKGEQDVVALYEKRFTQALVEAKQLGEAKETTDEYRTGMVIRPKQ